MLNVYRLTDDDHNYIISLTVGQPIIKATKMQFGNNECRCFFLKSHLVEKLAELSVPFSCSSCGNTCQEPPIYALFCYDFYSFRTPVFTFSLTENQVLYRGRKGLSLWAGKMVRMVRYWKWEICFRMGMAWVKTGLS